FPRALPRRRGSPPAETPGISNEFDEPSPPRSHGRPRAALPRAPPGDRPPTGGRRGRGDARAARAPRARGDAPRPFPPGTAPRHEPRARPAHHRPQRLRRPWAPPEEEPPPRGRGAGGAVAARVGR